MGYYSASLILRSELFIIKYALFWVDLLFFSLFFTSYLHHHYHLGRGNISHSRRLYYWEQVARREWEERQGCIHTSQVHTSPPYSLLHLLLTPFRLSHTFLLTYSPRYKDISHILHKVIDMMRHNTIDYWAVFYFCFTPCPPPFLAIQYLYRIISIRER